MKLFRSLIRNFRSSLFNFPSIPPRKSKLFKNSLIISINFFGFFKPRPEISDITTALQLGHYYTLNSRFEEADSAYHTVFTFLKPPQELTEDEIRDQNISLIHVYYSLSQLYMITNQLTRAERLILDCMRLCLQVGLDKTDNAVVELSLLLARIYSAQNKNELSEKGYQFCLDTQNDKIDGNQGDDDTLALLGITYYDYAHHCLKIGDLTRGSEFYEKALSIARGLFKGDHPQICTLLNDLSTVCLLLGQKERAEKLLGDAIRIAEEVDYVYVHRLYYNWAVVLSGSGKKAESAKWVKRARELAKVCQDDEFLNGTFNKLNFI